MTDTNNQCPRCSGYTVRIRRRSIDRLISLFMPVQRYQCQHYNCHWQGNIRVDYNGAPSLSRHHKSRQNSSKDVSFTV